MQKLVITYCQDGLEVTVQRDTIQVAPNFFYAFDNATEPDQLPNPIMIQFTDLVAITTVELSADATKQTATIAHNELYEDNIKITTQHLLLGKEEREYEPRELLMPLERAFYADTAVDGMEIMSRRGMFLRTYLKTPKKQQPKEKTS